MRLRHVSSSKFFSASLCSWSTEDGIHLFRIWHLGPQVILIRQVPEASCPMVMDKGSALESVGSCSISHELHVGNFLLGMKGLAFGFGLLSISRSEEGGTTFLPFISQILGTKQLRTGVRSTDPIFDSIKRHFGLIWGTPSPTRQSRNLLAK